MGASDYDFVYFKELDDFFPYLQTLEELTSDICKQAPYAKDLAIDTQMIISFLRKLMPDHIDPLKDSWRAFDRWQDGGTTEETFKKALQEYREEKERKGQ